MTSPTPDPCSCAALALVAAACSARRHASASPVWARLRRPPRTRPAAEPRCGTAAGRPGDAPTLTPVLVSNAITCGKARILFLFLDAQNRVASAPDRTVEVAFYNLGRDPNKAGRDGRRRVHLDDRERARHVRRRRRPSRGRAPGAPIHDRQAPRLSRPRRSVTFEVRDDTDRGRRRPEGARPRRPRRSPTSAATSRRSRPTPKPDPAFYETSVADALAAHKPFVLVFATPKFCQTAHAARRSTSSSRSPRQPGRDVHQRRAVPAQGRRRSAPARPRSEQAELAHRRPMSTDEWGLLSEPWIFVVDRDGIVSGSFELMITDAELKRDHAGHHDGRLTGRRCELSGASSSRTATVSPPSVRYQTRTGWAVAWCSTRCPGGNSAPFSSSPSLKTSVPSSIVRRSKPRTSVRPARSTATMTPSTAVASGGAARIDQRAATEQERGGRRHGDDSDEDQREQVPGAAIHDSAARVATAISSLPRRPRSSPSRCSPGAWSGVPSAQRGQVAGPGS